ncbi:MAG: exodeoxyribonuclease III [Alphaproteobacteria bacterium]|nr:exodeoxyribonuclease III [Alphaproteobacteria bacterium]
MLISTFNINSINARLEQFVAWLNEKKPDIVLLQELKCDFNSFPFFEINMAGYDAKIVAQKAYNGVAILSRHKIKTVCEKLPDFDDDNARYLEATVNVKGTDIQVISVYFPNGNPPYNNLSDNSKFIYKLNFTDAFYRHMQSLILNHEKIVIGGDFNVILTDNDVYNPELFANNALYKDSVKRRLKALMYLGFYDAYRVINPQKIGYTYWDYANKAFEQDLGLRIDYLLLSPTLTDALTNCYVDKTLRAKEKPSDHTVLSAEIDI